MDTNTIMLIALAIIIVLSALAIWLANRGSGVEEPPHERDSLASDDVVEHETASQPKSVDSKKVSKGGTTDRKVSSDVKADSKGLSDDKSDIRIVDNTKKSPVVKPPLDSKDNVNQGRDLKNPPKNR